MVSPQFDGLPRCADRRRKGSLASFIDNSAVRLPPALAAAGDRRLAARYYALPNEVTDALTDGEEVFTSGMTTKTADSEAAIWSASLLSIKVCTTFTGLQPGAVSVLPHARYLG